MRTRSTLFRCVLGAAVLTGAASSGPAQPLSVLLFTRTAGFRHDSIPAGVAAVRELGAANCFTVTHTEDGAAFTPANLAGFDVVVFLNTTGDVLNTQQEGAFESFILAGGGFVGIHSAADTEHGWPFYGQLIGARFASHPAPQTAGILIDDAAHLSTSHLPNPWTRFDEWYNYQSNPRGVVRVLARLDESTYSGGAMGADHPITWCHESLGGRSWYTGGGHTIASFAEPDFRRHILGGVLWAAHREAFPLCAPDFNCDGVRNPDDLSDFITCFFLDVMTPGSCAGADFNRDGARDPDDLSDFVTAFFLGC